MPEIASSRTSSPTSGKSSTSDPRRVSGVGRGARLAGLIRLIHPFPSLLDGVATTAIALLAGADLPSAVRLGGAMVALQASIGALNDIVDAPADSGRKPGKPIPSGVVSPGLARAVVVVGATTGVVLAAASGPWLVATSILILAIGYGYDLWAKGTRWSWLPFAVGIPMLPVFAWLGAAGRLPGAFAILVPAAVVAGTALAIANARADLERDTSAGQASVVTWLGQETAWRLSVGLFGGVIAVAVGSRWFGGASLGSLLPIVAASVLLAVGLFWASGSVTSPAARERAWQIQAIGVALLAAAWLASFGDLG
jgi:4-hydroxybenzoate polyprenyltransferase